MDARQQLTSFGPSNSFSFLHYSVQEFLAAWHMFRLGSEEQAKAVSDVLHSSPLSSVLPFFAGLTGVSSPAVRDILLKVTKYPLDAYSFAASKLLTESDGSYGCCPEAEWRHQGFDEYESVCHILQWNMT